MGPAHKYENVQPADEHDNDRESSRSSTEVESLIDEKSWQAQQRQRKSKRSTLAGILSSSRWMLDTTLLLMIITLLVRNEMQEPVRDQWQLLGDMTGVGPRFPQRLTKFEPDMSYAPLNSSEFFTDEVLDKWTSLIPKGTGYQLIVDMHHQYHDLPEPLDWPNGMTVYTTSVTHQLHCLFIMAQTYSGLKSGHEIPDDHNRHVAHCIAYLRQAIMCSADTALEGRPTTLPEGSVNSDGWDATHVCKDYSQVKDYLEKVRAQDNQTIF